MPVQGAGAEKTVTHLLLIDVAHLFYVAWHATSDQEVSAAYTKTLEKVAKVRAAVEHTHCAICCDHGPYWRHELSGGTYKAQRLQPSEAMMEQFARVRERLAADGLAVWRVKAYEADDIIATAVRIATERGHRVTIASGDKDLMQCVSDTVSLFNTNQWTTFDAAAVREKFGVDPSQMADMLALWGDTSDNVVGIPGIGPKKAADLLNKFGNGTAAIQAAQDGDKLSLLMPKAVCEALRKYWKNYAIALALVSLKTDVPINYDEALQERKPQSLSKEPRDMDAEDEELISSPQAKVPSEPPPAPAPEQPRAIQNYQERPTPPTSFELGLEPTNMTQAYKLAAGLFDSRLYQRFGNAEAIFAVVIRGREMGLGALTALDAFHVIEGKPSPSAHLLIAQAKKHPDCEYFVMVDSSATSATYETKNRRNPRTERITYTLEQAKQAGLCPEEMRTKKIDGKDSRSQWEKRPDEMLRKTCAVQLARSAYPDVMLGLTAHEETEF